MSFLREKVIVSVDDFGIRNVADAILPLAKQGKLDRVSVLIHYITSQEQANDLKATGVKIDLHLELIDIIKSGATEEGNALFRGINFMTRYVFRMVNSNNVERAWIDQIERFKEVFGQYHDGFNSHEHVHFFQRFFKVAMALGDRYHIPFIRFSRTGIMNHETTLVGRILAFLWSRDRDFYQSHASLRETSDFFVSYDWIADADMFLQSLPAGTTEIAFHPERKNEYMAIDKYF